MEKLEVKNQISPIRSLHSIRDDLLRQKCSTAATLSVETFNHLRLEKILENLKMYISNNEISYRAIQVSYI